MSTNRVRICSLEEAKNEEEAERSGVISGLERRPVGSATVIGVEFHVSREKERPLQWNLLHFAHARLAEYGKLFIRLCRL